MDKLIDDEFMIAIHIIQIVFEAIRGSSQLSDIAIDDVSMHSGACPPPGACDFEKNNLCTWANSKGDDFDWVVQAGQTISAGTGPQADHTIGTDSGLLKKISGFLHFSVYQTVCKQF